MADFLDPDHLRDQDQFNKAELLNRVNEALRATKLPGAELVVAHVIDAANGIVMLQFPDEIDPFKRMQIISLTIVRYRAAYGGYPIELIDMQDPNWAAQAGVTITSSDSRQDGIPAAVHTQQMYPEVWPGVKTGEVLSTGAQSQQWENESTEVLRQATTIGERAAELFGALQATVTHYIQLFEVLRETFQGIEIKSETQNQITILIRFHQELRDFRKFDTSEFLRQLGGYLNSVRELFGVTSITLNVLQDERSVNVVQLRRSEGARRDLHDGAFPARVTNEKGQLI
jgi:hypothetical protein